MLSLEHVKLLEERVSQTIDYIQHIQRENKQLREKLDAYQSRIDELELLVASFKDEQGKIEDGILSALDRLSQFEIAVEKGLNKVNDLAKEQTEEAEENEALPQAQAEGESPESIKEKEEAQSDKLSEELNEGTTEVELDIF